MAEADIRIAMWSGPRNISTAMMRAWGNRADTFVIDEPFYAFYLKETGADHPGADEVIAASETDWREIIAQLTGPIPNGARIFYQKQMTHHLLPKVSRDWLREVTNCFLIRDPAEVITSYIKKNRKPTVEDLGFVQQVDIFDFLQRQTGSVPPVMDADDAAGPRETDGVWAKYWYAEVERSTSFAPYRERKIEVPKSLHEVHARGREIYEELYQHRLH